MSYLKCGHKSLIVTLAQRAINKLDQRSKHSEGTFLIKFSCSCDNMPLAYKLEGQNQSRRRKAMTMGQPFCIGTYH